MDTPLHYETMTTNEMEFLFPLYLWAASVEFLRS